ncbi:dihydrofolate reductase family protein [Mycobacterium sp. HM-7]
MGALYYSTTISLDGYVADADGDFQWSGPDDAVFAVHLARLAGVSTEVLGRKTFALMQYWEDFTGDANSTADEVEFARGWRGIDKVVVSSTLTRADLGAIRARLVPELTLAELRRIVDDAPGAVEIFGPTTAAAAIRAGMIDDFHLFVVPKVVGGGLRALPDDVRLDLRLVEQQVFDNGTLYLHYQPR